jgi:hypothetical protein
MQSCSVQEVSKYSFGVAVLQTRTERVGVAHLNGFILAFARPLLIIRFVFWQPAAVKQGRQGGSKPRGTG